MTPDRSTIVLLLVVTLVLLGAGCVGQQIDNNSTALPTENVSIAPTFIENPTLSSDQDGKGKLAAIAPFLLYKENMTEWQRKLPTQLLEIIDPNFPKMGITPEQVKKMMRGHDQLLYADEAIKQFNIRNSSMVPVGDHVHIYILTNSSVSLEKMETMITKIEWRGKDFYSNANKTVAWVDLNNIEKISSLNEVIRVDIIFQGETTSSQS
jgi:hypothetical protein